MNQTDSHHTITSFSLGELYAASGVEQRKGVLGGCITASSSTEMAAFRFPCRIDALILGIGTEGETSVSFNLREHRLEKDSLFVFAPKQILQVHSEEPFKADVLVLSSELMQSINIDVKRMMPLFLRIAAHPSLKITSDESGVLRSFIAQVERELRGEETRFTQEIVSSLIGATLYKVGDVLDRYLAEHPDPENPVRNRGEEYFKEFLELLGAHYKQERSVGFYAQRLCITPKYLTTLIKRISGKSVSEWIDSYVTIEAKTLLKYSAMSVQEIAYYLNFPNQSFFGSYFKRNTGMSPSQYKMQN